MKFDMKRPLTFKGGVAAALMFSRVNVAGMLELASLGDILSPEASAEYACRYGRAVTADGIEFPIIESDITDCTSPAPAIAAGLAFTQVRDFDKSLGNGESIPKDILDGGEAIIRLKYPITIHWTVGTEDQKFPVEWLVFSPQKYSDVSEFVRSYLTGKADTIVTFIRSFASPMNVPDDYPLKRLTDAQVGLIDASDAERIAQLVMENFIEVPGL